MIRVWILNDYEQGKEGRQAIENALNARFKGQSIEVEEFPEPINLHAVSPDLVARRVRSLQPEPEILLVDGHMPDPEDGVRVIDALRKAGYRGFTYLWSMASPHSDVESQPGMFEPPGAGGFRSSDLEGLAAAVWKSWKDLGGFEVQRPEERILRDPLSPALWLLSELQAGLFAAIDGTVTQADWNEVCARARRWFDYGQASFCSAIRPFQNRGLDLSDANFNLESLPSMPLSNLPAIEERVRQLRDCLLRVVESCR